MHKVDKMPAVLPLLHLKIRDQSRRVLAFAWFEAVSEHGEIGALNTAGHLLNAGLHFVRVGVVQLGPVSEDKFSIGALAGQDP
jgi:hypothetical protein